MRGIASALLAAALLAAGAVDSALIAEEPWGTTCELDWCEPRPQPHRDILDGMADRAAAERLVRPGDTCVGPAGADFLPDTMIVRTAAGAVRRVPWRIPPDDGQGVLLLCAT